MTTNMKRTPSFFAFFLLISTFGWSQPDSTTRSIHLHGSGGYRNFFTTNLQQVLPGASELNTVHAFMGSSSLAFWFGRLRLTAGANGSNVILPQTDYEIELQSGIMEVTAGYALPGLWNGWVVPYAGVEQQLHRISATAYTTLPITQLNGYYSNRFSVDQYHLVLGLEHQWKVGDLGYFKPNNMYVGIYGRYSTAVGPSNYTMAGMDSKGPDLLPGYWSSGFTMSFELGRFKKKKPA